MSLRSRRWTAPRVDRARRLLLFSVATLLATLTTVLPSGPAVAYPSLARIAGTTRYDTAAQISAHSFPSNVPVAVIATAATFPDALAGGAAAARLGGPVLLVARDAVPDSVATELRRLAPRRIVVVGGPAAVSDVVVTALAGFTAGGVSRVFGADRYDTAAAVSAATFAPGIDTAYVATGADFPDALSGTAAAASAGAPVLLVAPNAVPASIAAELRRLHPATIVALGGAAAVSAGVQTTLASMAATVTRIGGSNRYDTSVAVAAAAFPAAKQVFLATGEGFPDALAAGPAAALAGGPVLLVSPGCVPRTANTWMRQLDYPPITVVGGTAAVHPAAAALTPCAGAPDGSIGPGVTLRTIVDPAGPFVVKVVTVDPAAASTLDVALAGDVLPGLETTSSMARRRGALAAINGDFALSGGRPARLFGEDGRLVQTAQGPGANFEITADEMAAAIGPPATHITATVSETAARAGIDLVNSGTPAQDQLALFTPAGGGLEPPPGGSCWARLRPAEAAHVDADGQAVQQHLVDTVGCGAPPPALAGDDVLSAPILGSRAPFVQALAPGQRVAIAWNVGLPGVLDTIGGNPVLVRDGAVLGTEVDGTGGFFDRNPRTGVGIGRDGHILLVTVDGRAGSGSVGMTLREFAALFLRLGATDALNLDGGGSTTMVVEGAVQNHPSDGYERPVDSALLVLPGPDPGERPTSALAPAPAQTPAALARARLAGPGSLPPTPGTGDAMLHDPGSTGGLADALRRSGEPLSAPLRHAATTYEESR